VQYYFYLNYQDKQRTDQMVRNLIADLNSLILDHRGKSNNLLMLSYSYTEIATMNKVDWLLTMISLKLSSKSIEMVDKVSQLCDGFQSLLNSRTYKDDTSTSTI